MTINPSAGVLTIHEAQRRAHVQAEADRDRRGRLAQGGGALRPHWPDVAAVMAVVLLLALLALVGPPAADRELGWQQPGQAGAHANTLTQVVDAGLLDPGAVQTISANRF